MKPLYDFCGGRKVFLGYLSVAVLSVGAALMETADFGTWAMWVVTSLGISKATTAWVDRAKHSQPEEDLP